MYRERIRTNYGTLSKSQKRIADYLLTSQREAAFMTASRMATILNVDVATITRFAQRLGYPGYPELLAEVQHEVRDEMAAAGRLLEGSGERSRLFMRAMASELENLDRTLSAISTESVQRALDVLSEARRVYLVGQYTGVYMANNLMLRLSVLGIEATVIAGDEVAVAFNLRSVGPGDVIIGFGFSGYARDVAAALRIGQERGASTIGITGSEVSAVARSSSIVLVCSAVSAMHIPSETAVTALIESLFAALGAERQDRFKQEFGSFGATHDALVDHKSHSDGAVTDSVMKFY